MDLSQAEDEVCDFSSVTLINRFGSMYEIYKKLGINKESESSGEARYIINIISEYLEEIPSFEWTEDWLRNPITNNNLYVDAYFKKYNLAVEYDGEYHFKYIKYFHKNESKFLYRKKLDKIKDALLDFNNINIIHFDYTEPKDKEYIIEKIKTQVTK